MKRRNYWQRWEDRLAKPAKARIVHRRSARVTTEIAQPTPIIEPTDIMPSTQWGDDERDFAVHLHVDCHLTYEEIAKRLDRKVVSVKAKIESAIQRQQSAQLRQHARERLIERNRRIDTRDLTAVLMGDPLPGYSALDKQRDRSLIDDTMRKKIQAQSDEMGA